MFAFSLRLVAPYWKWLAIVIATMVVEIVMTLASPWPLKIVLDSVFGAEPIPPVFAWFTGPVTDRLALLNIAVGATVVIALLQAAGAYLNAYYTVSIGQWIAHDLRQSVYAHLQRLSLSYYDRHQVGPLISTITDDIDAVQEFISTSLLDLVIDSLTIAGMLVVMLSLNWRFTLVALAVTPLMLIFVYRLRAAVKSATHDVRRRQSELVTIVQEGLGAIRVVKAFAQGRFERQRLEAKSVESVEAALKARRVRSLLGPVVTALVALGTAAVLWFGARLVLEGAMTAGALVVFLTYLGRLFRPIQAVARASTNIAQATVGLERVRDVLDADDRLVRAPNAAPLGPVEGRVEFRDVTFGYDPSRPVLRDISFTIEPGQLVGLVGPSGGGKSTLVGLLARFYDPQQGAVLIDGRDIRETTIRSLRGQIGFVLQDTQLFQPRSGTTSPTAGPTPRATRSSMRRGWRRRTTSSRRFPRDTTPWWARAASRCREGSVSGWASHAPWFATRASWCSTNPHRGSTPRRNDWSSRRSGGCGTGGPASSSRIAWRRSGAPTSSWSLPTAALSSAARTRHLPGRAACTRGCSTRRSRKRKRGQPRRSGSDGSAAGPRYGVDSTPSNSPRSRLASRRRSSSFVPFQSGTSAM